MVNQSDVAKILAHFTELRPIIETATVALHGLVNRALQEAQFRVFVVEQRTKEIPKLLEKLSRPEKSYRALCEITDLVGIRVIVYFQDDVDRVAAVIKSHFFCHETVDKREYDNPREFGYQSLHEVIKLPEFGHTWTNGDVFCAEIQIRTVLQHAWAEIEHDLGYKARGATRAVSKRFARVAALVDLADEEFLRIRTSIVQRVAEVNEAFVASTEPTDLEVDNTSVKAFVASDVQLRTCDTRVAQAMGHDLSMDAPSEERVTAEVARMESIGVAKLSGLSRLLNEREEEVVQFAKEYALRPNRRTVPSPSPVGRAISIFYLAALIHTERGEAAVVEYLNRFGIGREDMRRALAKVFIDAAEKARHKKVKT